MCNGENLEFEYIAAVFCTLLDTWAGTVCTYYKGNWLFNLSGHFMFGLKDINVFWP